MTTRKVSLDVVVDDADPRLCAADCPYATGLGQWCELLGGGAERISADGDGRYPWMRTAACVSSSAIASADDAVLEAAEAWRDLKGAERCRDVKDTQVVNGGNLSRLTDAIDARRKLRATRGTEG